MNSKKSLLALGIALAIGASPATSPARQIQEEDSVYSYGRWSVLSPAAGVGEPYVAALAPGADNNLEPEISADLSPDVTEEGPRVVPVVESCAAGASCAFATYSRTDFAQDGTASDSPSGPAFASFAKTTFAVSDPSLPGPGGPGTVQPAAEGDRMATAFTVENDSMPPVESVSMLGSFSDGELSGAEGTSEFIPPAAGEPGLGSTETIDQTSVLSHNQQDSGVPFDFDGVEAGYWKDAAEKLVQKIVRDPSLPDEITPIYDADGYFVTGQTATLEAMQTFAAGNVDAQYQGVILDYGSDVTLNFNFGSNTFTGDFASGGGFQGFDIGGNVDGVNFSASEGVQSVNGSFFNDGMNASGGVNNGEQIGVFSADFVDGL